MIEGSPPPICHVSHLMCHVSCVTCHMSSVTGKCNYFFLQFFLPFFFFLNKLVKLGIVVDGPLSPGLPRLVSKRVNILTFKQILIVLGQIELNENNLISLDNRQTKYWS